MTANDVAAASRVGRRPSHTRLALLVVEGYAYLALIVGMFVGSVAYLAWGVLNRRPLITLAAILVGVPLTVTTARAVYALFFTIATPRGIAITPRNGGGLHAMVEDVRTRIGAPRVHRILVTGSFNASAWQVPRLGLFWPRNMLLVGYPMLATLSREQIRAVIAHELGHLTHSHGRFSSWVYRTRLTWARLLDSLDARQATPAHARALFHWYVPRLQAESAAVSRQQELLADRLAANAAGPQATAQALVASEIGGALLKRTFWLQIKQSVEENPEPPPAYATMGPDVWRAVGEDDQARFLDELLDNDSTPWDTHPSLRERLAHIGQRPQLPGAVPASAADELLGDQKLEIAAALDDEWGSARAADWHAEHQELRATRARLAELDALAQPTVEETLERARLKEWAGNEELALELYRAAFGAGSAAAGLGAGRVLLERNDETGIGVIEAAMEIDRSLEGTGCHEIVTFLERRGRAAAAHSYRVRQARATTQAKLAGAERTQLSLVDRFVHCDQPAIDRRKIAACVAAEPAILRAFLVGKALRHSSGTQMLLALVTSRTLAAQACDRLRGDCGLPEDTMVVVLGRHDQQIEAMLAAIDGANVYERAGQSRKP